MVLAGYRSSHAQSTSCCAKCTHQHAPVNVPRLSPVGANVDTDDLISAAEVQVILGLSHPSSVTTYLKRYSDFPQPVVDLSHSRVRLWNRQDIIHWHEARNSQ